MPLNLTYRPKTLDEVIGNTGIVSSLKTVLSREKDIPSMFMFSGPFGCGKTTLGRIVAYTIGTHQSDFHEFDAATSRGIDFIREFKETVNYAPLGGKRKVYLFDEAHGLTGDAENALLKVTEEPPSHTRFILCTSEPQKVNKGLRSRSMVFEVQPLSPIDMKKLLERILAAENIQDFPKSVIDKIVDLSDGVPRNATILLDQVIDILDENEALESLRGAVLGEATIKDMCQCILKDKPGQQKLKKLLDMAKLIKDQPESIRYAMKGYFEAVAINTASPRNIEILSLFLDSWMYSGRAGLICTLRLASDV